MTTDRQLPKYMQDGEFQRTVIRLLLPCLAFMWVFPALAATGIPLTVTLSEPVTVTGTPRLVLNVGDVLRHATYTSGTGTSVLTFTYTTQAGDVDLDGIGLLSPLDLNGGTISDLNGNPISNLAFTVPATTGIKINHPALAMDFAANDYILNGSHYASLASFLTAAGGSFTRTGTSQASYYNSSGLLQTATTNTPRFDHDPVTHAAQGLLFEESRTNRLLNSSNYSAWAQVTASVSAAAGTAPDGTNTAQRVIANTIGVNNGLISQNVSGSFTTYTLSIYAKAGSSNALRLQPNSNIDSVITGYIVTYDLSAVTTTIGGSYGGKFSNIYAAIQDVGNGWYRCSTTYTVTGSTYTGSLVSWIYPYTGTPAAGANILLWGAQLEIGAQASSYIPTTSAMVTRGADILSLPAASWFNQTNGAWFSQFSPHIRLTGTPRLIASSSSAGGFLNVNPFTITTYVAESYDGTNASTANAVPANAPAKAAAAYDAASKSVVLAGGAVQTVARSATFPLTPATTLYIGADAVGAQHFNGSIAAIRYYPARIVDTQLQLLSQ